MGNPTHSKCCLDSVRLSNGDEGTKFYICNGCDNACDVKENDKIFYSTNDNYPPLVVSDYGAKFEQIHILAPPIENLTDAIIELTKAIKEKTQ